MTQKQKINFFPVNKTILQECQADITNPSKLLKLSEYLSTRFQEFSKSQVQLMMFPQSLATQVIEICREKAQQIGLLHCYQRNYYDRKPQLQIFKKQYVFTIQYYQLPEQYRNLRKKFYTYILKKHEIVELKNLHFFDTKKILQLKRNFQKQLALEKQDLFKLADLFSRINLHFTQHSFKTILKIQLVPPQLEHTVRQAFKAHHITTQTPRKNIVSFYIYKQQYHNKQIERLQRQTKVVGQINAQTKLKQSLPKRVQNLRLVSFSNKIAVIEVESAEVQGALPILTYYLKITDSENRLNLSQAHQVQTQHLQTIEVLIQEQGISHIIIQVFPQNSYGVNNQAKKFKFWLPSESYKVLMAGNLDLSLGIYQRVNDSFYTYSVPILTKVTDIVLCCQHNSVVCSLKEGNCVTYGQILTGPDSSQKVGLCKFQKCQQVVQVQEGCKTVAMLTAEGQLLSCGVNQYGLIPTSKEIFQYDPIPIHPNKKFISLDLTYLHGVAVSKEGQLFSWGCNQTLNFSVPVQSQNFGVVNYTMPDSMDIMVEGQFRCISQGQKFIQAKTGFQFSCAITHDGELYVWGNNQHYQLGTLLLNSKDIQIRNINLPLRHSFFGLNRKAVKIAIGKAHALALVSQGPQFNLYSWGSNQSGQAGHGLIQSIIKSPRLVQRKVRGIFAGEDSSCLITCEEDLKVFGDNKKGQLCLQEAKISVPQSLFSKLPLDSQVSQIQKVSLSGEMMAILIR